MVTIKIGQQFIEITGHAQAGKVGEDIVCASVSVLGQSLKHIDELYREYNVVEENAETGAKAYLRVDFHDPLSVIQSYAVDRREHLEKQLENKVLDMQVHNQIKEELDNWEENCRNFALMAKSKGLIISNQIDLIVKTMREVAVSYPKYVEVVEC